MSAQKVPSITEKAQLQSLPADIPRAAKKQAFFILRLLNRTLSRPTPPANTYGLYSRAEGPRPPVQTGSLTRRHPARQYLWPLCPRGHPARQTCLPLAAHLPLAGSGCLLPRADDLSAPGAGRLPRILGRPVSQCGSAGRVRNQPALPWQHVVTPGGAFFPLEGFGKRAASCVLFSLFFPSHFRFGKPSPGFPSILYAC